MNYIYAVLLFKPAVLDRIGVRHLQNLNRLTMPKPTISHKYLISDIFLGPLITMIDRRHEHAAV